jgi:peptidoglycan/xylan/chitin deacetylase (PgdA/CDA1 family)
MKPQNELQQPKPDSLRKKLATAYFVKTPWWLKKLYSSYVWHIPTKERVVYFTFDDGPHERATSFVLDQLRIYDAKATFFCIGKNVIAHSQLYNRIIEEGHATGNHTFSHLNGWKTSDAEYLQDVTKASQCIDSNLFRPPYGRIKAFQAKHIPAAMKNPDAKIIMWDVLSGDFDTAITAERCLQNILLNIRAGSIVVLHDSEKAFPVLEYCLPRALAFCSEKGYRLESLENVYQKTKEDNLSGSKNR